MKLLFFIVVVVYNDNMVVGVLLVFEENGYLVFEYVLVIGFDDVLILCYLCLCLMIVCYLI